MIEIKGQYTLEDFKGAQKLHMQARKGGVLAALSEYFLFIMAVIILLATLILTLIMRVDWSTLVIPAVLAAGLAYAQFYFQPRQMKRVFEQQKDLSAPFTMEFSDPDYHLTNSYGESRFPWKDFAKWKENQALLLLYRSDVAFIMIPKRLFGAETDIQYLREKLLQNNVPDAYKVKNKRGLIRLLIYLFLFIAVVAMVYFNLQSAR